MLNANAEPLSVGSVAPSPTVIIETGESVDLSTVYAKGPTLVYFYPKADTPGCTKQACNLRDHFEDLEAKGVQVVGVSSDRPEAQMKFKEKYNLPFTLVADEDKELGKAFGVGGIAFGLVFKRQSFLIVDGKIAWRDLKASPASQTEDALSALAAIQ